MIIHKSTKRTPQCKNYKLQEYNQQEKGFMVIIAAVVAIAVVVAITIMVAIIIAVVIIIAVAMVIVVTKGVKEGVEQEFYSPMKRLCNFE